MRLNRRSVVGLVLASVALLSLARSDEGSGAPTISFATQVRPIFNQHCIACHGGIKQTAGISFVYRDTVVGTTADDGKVVVPGNPGESELIARISSTDPDERMPPQDHGGPLSPDEIGILRQWIAEGARWETHWAFEPPKHRPIPKVSHAEWCRTNLDFSVMEQWDRLGLKPNRPADPATWLRRVSFDLVGLPPTAEELDEFLIDSSPLSREHVVERLLSSPRFGERWASPWLDLARYADTMGYEKDLGREIWPFRDWVIRALNDDMPFDQFSVKQLAGDLLPNASLDDRLATAFHRNTQTNAEGGTDDEEYRVAAVIDRANTSAQVWLGLTLGCAQCHDHPYEPIANAEYYRFLAFFNNTRDYDTDEEFPKAAIPYDRNQSEAASQLDRDIQARKRQIQASVEPWFGDDRWQNAQIESAQATGSNELFFDAVDGLWEIRTGASLTAGSTYTIDCPLPPEATRITAIRLDALPLDVGAAAKLPQPGFILSYFKLQLLVPDRDPIDIPLRYALDEDPEPFYSASESLDSNLQGFSGYPRQSQINRAIFVPAVPVDCPPGGKLRFVLEHHSSSEHLFQIRRARFWYCGDDFWSEPPRQESLELKHCALADLEWRRSRLNSISVPVLSELPPERRRTTFVFHRGSFLEPTEIVTPSTPRALSSSKSNPLADRLELARWLASPENPLAARVFVNRIWNELFGSGIVESIENFGSSGQFPANEALLDSLAIRFQSGMRWRLKQLLREIVLSSTYGQDSSVDRGDWSADSHNRNLARGPRNRLSAEMVRDQALAVAGVLSEKMYGPPVMPPQPDGLWLSAYNGQSWHNATGEDRFRRAVYTYCKRTSGYPGLLSFDAPTRDVCVVKRIATNTPLQALVTLNDAAFVELAHAFGERIRNCDRADPRDKIAWGYRLATSGDPSPKKLDLLLELFEKISKSTDPLKVSDEAEAPYSIVASALLNLDEALTK